MTDFKGKILSSGIGRKVLRIEFAKEELGELLELLDKKIKIKVMGYGH